MPRPPRRRPRDIVGWPYPEAVPLAERETAEGEAVVELLGWLETTSKAMERRGMTQQQLAELTGVGLRTINRTFTGGAWPELPTMIAINRTLGGAPGLPHAIDDRWRATCHHCDDTLLLSSPHRPPTPYEVYEVVTDRHGHVWTGMRCLPADDLLTHGYTPDWPPNPDSRWDT